MTNSNENFNSLIKDKAILQAIQNMGITVPTEIQIKSIPIILQGKNIIAESATGTGKTIAFLAGILQDVSRSKKVQALIVVPTRELALQVFKEAKKVSEIKKLESCAVYGGESISTQAREIRFADIVIGTPGRIIDQINRGNLNIKDLKYLVLDEADRMCDMGFYEDISRIIEESSKNKQILLFSATISKDVSSIEKKYIQKAERVSVESKVDPTNLLQEYYVVKSNQKFSLLLHLIKENKSKSIVFCNTRKEVDVLFNNFVKNKVEVFKLHGGLEQRKRTHTIGKYHDHKDAVLISSDVSARGIHVENIEYIYNYDLPKDDTQYVHRIGRTARAGKKGKAITILLESEEITFIKMCRHYGFLAERIKLPVMDVVFLDRQKNNVDDKRGSFRKSKSNDFFNKQLDFLNGSKDSNRSDRGPARDRDSRGPPRDRDSRGPPRDRDSRGPPRDRDSRGPPRDRDSRGPPRDRDSRGPARDRDSRGPARDRDSRGPPRDRNKRGPPRDRDSRGPPRDRDSRGPPRDRDSRGPPREGGQDRRGSRNEKRGRDSQKTFLINSNQDKSFPRGDFKRPEKSAKELHGREMERMEKSILLKQKLKSGNVDSQKEAKFQEKRKNDFKKQRQKHKEKKYLKKR